MPFICHREETKGRRSDLLITMGDCRARSARSQRQINTKENPIGSPLLFCHSERSEESIKTSNQRHQVMQIVAAFDSDLFMDPSQAQDDKKRRSPSSEGLTLPSPWL